MLRILLLLASFQLGATDYYLGGGFLVMADDQEGEAYSLVVQDKKWKYSIARFTSYGRTSWYPDHPEWGQRIQDDHFVASVTKRVHRTHINDNLNFYIDFGFSYVDKLSRVNSTHLLFRENFGFEYKDLRLYWRRTSNAGIKQPNTGEDAIILEYKIDL